MGEIKYPPGTIIHQSRKQSFTVEKVVKAEKPKEETEQVTEPAQEETLKAKKVKE